MGWSQRQPTTNKTKNIMIKELIKAYIKKNQKNIISIIAIAIVAIVLVVKLAVPLLTVCGLVILCLGGLYFLKRKNKVQIQVGGDNSNQVQYSSDKKTWQVQEGGKSSNQSQISED